MTLSILLGYFERKKYGRNATVARVKLQEYTNTLLILLILTGPMRTLEAGLLILHLVIPLAEVNTAEPVQFDYQKCRVE